MSDPKPDTSSASYLRIFTMLAALGYTHIKVSVYKDAQ